MVVYKGRKKTTVEYFAIKSIEKCEKPRVLQEVRTFHTLDHDNVLKFHAWYETANHLWLILEYCVGGDLLALLRQDSKLPEESIHDFARDCAQALQFLHSNSIIYADFKPSNVLLDENGRPKLCDFGLARRLTDIAKGSQAQAAVPKRGTPCYMAPELLQEGGVLSFASDLWALGCVMYECYAGHPPFHSPTFSALVSAILTEPPPPLPGTPSVEFQDLVMRLLDKNPGTRMGWEELREHPFWQSPIKALPLPPQPALKNFLRAQAQAEAEAQALAQAQAAARNGGVRGAGEGREVSGSGEREGRVALGDVAAACGNAGDGGLAGSAEGRRDVLAGGGNGSKGGNGGENGGDGGPGRGAAPPVAAAATAVQAAAVAPATPGTPAASAGGAAVSAEVVAASVLRLSRIVRSNLQKDAEGAEGAGGSYRHGGGLKAGSREEVLLASHDMEVDLEERGHGAEQERGAHIEDAGVESGEEGASSGGEEAGVGRARKRGTHARGSSDVEDEGEGEGARGKGEEEDEGEEDEAPARTTAAAAAAGTGTGAGAALPPVAVATGAAVAATTVALTTTTTTSMTTTSMTGGSVTSEEIELDLSSGAATPLHPSSARHPRDARKGAGGRDGGREGRMREGEEEEVVGGLAAEGSGEGEGEEQQVRGGGEEKRGDGKDVVEGSAHTEGEGAQQAGAAEGRREQGAKAATEGRGGRGSEGEGRAAEGPAAAGGAGAAAAEAEKALSAVDVMWHASDVAVKPIVLNRRIEKLPEPAFDARHLPMDPLAPADLVKLAGGSSAAEGQQQRGSSSAADAMLGRLVGVMSGSFSLADKLNVLKYVESLAYDPDAANVVINSPLMVCLVKFLRNCKVPALRVELCTAIGLLVRHATAIRRELAASGLVGVLAECLRDKQEKVRRRAMAALGEMAFYIATQSPTPAAAAAAAAPSPASGLVVGAAAGGGGWQLTGTTVTPIMAMLRRGEDEVTMHYAVKTIENIVSEGPAWAARFATQETVGNLCHIFRHSSSRQEHLKLTAGSCLVRILRFAPSWVALVLDRIGPKEVVTALAKAAPREQQLLLSLVNVALAAAAAGQLPARQMAALTEDKGGLPAVAVGLLLQEQATEVLRGKALCCVALLLRTNWRLLVPFCTAHKLVPALERVRREAKPGGKEEAFVGMCVEAGVRAVGAAAAQLMAQIPQDVSVLVAAVAATTSASASSPIPSGALSAPSPSAGSLSRKAGAAAAAAAAAVAAVAAATRTGSGGGAGDSSPHTTQQQAMQQQALQASIVDMFAVVVMIMTSPLLRPLIVEAVLLQQLTDCLSLCLASSASLYPLEQLLAAVLQAVEALCQQPQQLLQHTAALASGLLPALAQLYSKAPAGETRFMCIKVMGDLFALLLDHLTALRQQGRAQQEGEGEGEGEEERERERVKVECEAARAVVQELVCSEVLPLYGSLMTDDEPVPTFAQKLLVNFLDHSIVSVDSILSLGLAACFFERLVGEPAAINMHTLRLCLILAANPAVDKRAFAHLHLVPRMGALLEHVWQCAMADFVDPVVSLCLLVLERQVADNGSGEQEGGAGEEEVEQLAEFTRVFVHLCADPDPVVADIASDCLSLLLHAVPDHVGLALAPHIPDVTTVLASTVQQLQELEQQQQEGGAEAGEETSGAELALKVQVLLLRAAGCTCKELRTAIVRRREEVAAPVAELQQLLGLASAAARSSAVEEVVEAASSTATDVQRLLRCCS
ncbi:unnamed protein product [Closterium sp. Naga37s-1]|nr:unnamed protein product [Closterium sp. Naga37s-1]